MEKEIKSYLNYVKNLSYSDLVKEGQLNWRKYLEHISDNREIEGKTILFVYYTVMASNSDGRISEKEIQYISAITGASLADVRTSCNNTQENIRKLDYSKQATLGFEMGQYTARYIKDREEMLALCKIAALIIAVDKDVTMFEKVVLSNISDMCKKF